MKNGTVVVALLLAGLSLAKTISASWSEWIALGLIILAGIPHGSFDLRVAEAKWSKGTISKRMIVSLYVASVFLMSGLCVMVPPLGLALFLVISAIHFSEGERYDDGSSSWLRASLFGVGAILLPIGFHLKDAGEYMGYFISPEYFSALSPFIFGGAALAVPGMCFFVLVDARAQEAETRAAALQRALCLVGWIALSPLAGFAVWFIGRHSRLHLQVCREMFRASRFGVPLDFILISGLAILGLSPFALLFDFRDINQLFAASISLIAGLTLPHIFVAHGLKGVVEAREL